MENRRTFSRQQSELMVVFAAGDTQCVGEIRNLGLGGLRARVPKKHFKEGQEVTVSPQDGETLSYEVCWLREVGAGYELGLRYPHSVAGFWHSWAADILADARPTNGEVLERRSQVRLGCLLSGHIKVKRKQYSVRILDIGGGGALIEMEEALPEGASGQLTVKTPVRVGHVPCRVVRAWPGKPARYGLEFVDVRERHRLALVRLLDVLFRQQAG